MAIKGELLEVWSSQHSSGVSQPPLTLEPGDPMLSSGLRGYPHTCVHTVNTHTHNSKIS